jgi:hypothetical protein
MIKVYLLLIALCIAQCSFLENYSEDSTSCGINVKCSMVPYVKSCEEYDYCLKDGWYYNVKYHECQKIHIKDGYYPTDNFYKTKADCDCACHEANTISYSKNLDPTYECKKSPDFYSKGYKEQKYSGSLWTYQSQYKKCVKFNYPECDYQPSYNVFYSKLECEDFCINYLYDHDHDDYDYKNDDYNYNNDDYNYKNDDYNYKNDDDNNKMEDYNNKMEDYNYKMEDYNNKNDDNDYQNADYDYQDDDDHNKNDDDYSNKNVDYDYQDDDYDQDYNVDGYSKLKVAL